MDQELIQAKQKFRNQKYKAQQRGIDWQLTFDQWYKWWQDTGHWHQRGITAGKYVMSRYGDQGPYSLDNIFCQTRDDNCREGNVKLKGRAAKSFTEEHRKHISQSCLGRVPWNKGTIGIQKSGMEGKQHKEDSKKRIGIKNSKPIMTPAGKFASRVEAAKHYSITPAGIGARTKYYPKDYYYL